jgi:hypothetical protein
LKIPKGGNHNLHIEEEQTTQWQEEKNKQAKANKQINKAKKEKKPFN